MSGLPSGSQQMRSRFVFRNGDAFALKLERDRQRIDNLARKIGKAKETHRVSRTVRRNTAHE